jgi:hypothetical protein
VPNQSPRRQGASLRTIAAAIAETGTKINHAGVKHALDAAERRSA